MGRRGLARFGAGVVSGAALASVACISSSNTPPAPDSGAPAGDSGGVADGGAGDVAEAGAGLTAEGLYFGSIADGGTEGRVAALVTSSGSYWIWQYGPGSVGGGAVGVGTSEGSTFTTTQAEAATPSVTATFVSGTSFDGTIGDPDASTTSFQAAASGTYHTEASLSTVVGAWDSEVYSASYGDETETITITSGGAITMDNPLGCTATGTIAPHAGHGYYDLTVTFQGGACIAGTGTLTGVAVVDTSNPGAPQLLTSILTLGTDGGADAIDFPTWGVTSPDGG